MVKPPPLALQKLRSKADLDAISRPSSFPEAVRNPFLGFCYVCNDLASFDIEQGENVNFRETLKCRGCNLVNRTRASVHLMELEGDFRSDPGQRKIYVTEQSTDLFQAMMKRYPNVVGSEFLGPAVEWGANNLAGIRNEDLTRLTFASESFDAVLCLEVFEHLPGFEIALVEILRVLKPGGKLFFSIPFWASRENTVVRASVRPDGKITHHLPPEYHLDPNHAEGCLCYYDFGWDLIGKVERAGFENAYAVYYPSSHYGYLGQSGNMGGTPIQFAAHKANLVSEDTNHRRLNCKD